MSSDLSSDNAHTRTQPPVKNNLPHLRPLAQQQQQLQQQRDRPLNRQQPCAPPYAPNRTRASGVKATLPINNTISELYSSYDDESLNRHRLSRANYFQLKSNSSTSLSSISSAFSPRSVCRKRSDLKKRNKSLGSVVEAAQNDSGVKSKSKSYMRSNFCLVMSCAKENESTYTQKARTIVECSPKREILKQSDSGSKSSSSSSYCAQYVVDEVNQFVSTDDCEDYSERVEVQRFQRRHKNARYGASVLCVVALCVACDLTDILAIVVVE